MDEDSIRERRIKIDEATRKLEEEMADMSDEDKSLFLYRALEARRKKFYRNPMLYFWGGAIAVLVAVGMEGEVPGWAVWSLMLNCILVPGVAWESVKKECIDGDQPYLDILEKHRDDYLQSALEKPKGSSAKTEQ